MVKIELLLEEKKISKINELELNRYEEFYNSIVLVYLKNMGRLL